MSQNIDFKELRNKVYLSYHQDGLIDIIIGASILGFGLLIATDNSAFMVLTWIGFILYTPLKNRLTVPRLGYVRFDEERKTAMRYVLMIVFGVLVLAMFIGLYVFVRSDSMPQTLSDWFRQYHMLVLGFFMAIPLIAFAYWSGVNRLAIYAGLLLQFLQDFLSIQEQYSPYQVLHKILFLFFLLIFYYPSRLRIHLLSVYF